MTTTDKPQYRCPLVSNIYRDYPYYVVLAPDGHLNGYVEVPRSHVAYGRHYYDGLDSQINCHGGLTYSGHMELGSPINNVNPLSHYCWYIGFDCAHYGDLVPTMGNQTGHDIWRNDEFVANECKHIIDQLIEMRSIEN